MALDWTPNTNHVGLYVAQAQGWYKDAGLEVELLPYTDTPSTTLVESGVAEIWYFTALGYYSRKAAGADLIATYCHRRSTRPGGWCSGRPGRHPDTGGPGRDDLWRVRHRLGKDAGRHDDPQCRGRGQFDTVTLGTSAYEALAAGRVDFTLEVAHWEGVAAQLAGRAQRGFDYADWGIPDEQNGFIGMRQDWLDAHEDTARAFIQATARGYAWAAGAPGRSLGDADRRQRRDAVGSGSGEGVDAGDPAARAVRDAQGRVGRFDPAVCGHGRFLVDNGILTGAGWSSR